MAGHFGRGFPGKLPQPGSAGPPKASSAGDEVLAVVPLPDVELAGGTSEDGRAAARSARIDRFREETRDERVRIASEAESHFRRKVAWGARCGDQVKVFTTLSVPVMTRLRMTERSIFDTVVTSGVARKRRYSLASCVGLV